MFEFTLPANPYSISDEIAEIAARQIRENNEPRAHKLATRGLRIESSAIYRLQAQVAVEGFRLISDESWKSGGTNGAPAPARFFLAGILLCVQVWVVKLACLNKVPVRSLRCQAESYREFGTEDEMPEGTGFGRIDITVCMDTEWGTDRDDQIEAIVGEAARRCPAAVTVARGTDLRVFAVHNGSVRP